MRIFDEKNDRALDEITIYLTPEEARQLASYCEQLADDPVRWHHSHLSEIVGDRVEREITVAVYVDENMNQVDAHARRLIETGDAEARP
jgi:predicted FMN-binding regulatory protein PaiB